MLGNCFGSDTLKKTAVYEWHECFKSGRESVEDDERSGRPSKTDENINKRAGRGLKHFLWINLGHCINGLGLRRVAAKLNQTQHSSNASLLETWVYEYDMQSRHQASEWKASKPRPKKSRFQSKKKAMLTVFMDYKGIVHYEFLPEDQTVNKEYYLGVMRCLREAVRQTRKDLWANNSWILHHDNAPSHSAIIIREFLTKNETNTIQQPLNSPDMAPCDFFLKISAKEVYKLSSPRTHFLDLIAQNSFLGLDFRRLRWGACDNQTARLKYKAGNGLAALV
ncbi:PREDICTED: histone-lysine N-methyltransferase SETMAR-like [Atta colombica]|uniref:histone-lysine N-methyltransferase SETMAR-like n=1 Tax=Atta colombica TaxID=520822 RepID=UPI00084BD67B|nr:PREDICTED: histone-lysine N-methyltransferase SETMAR-like [Atta colombica]